MTARRCRTVQYSQHVDAERHARMNRFRVDDACM